MSAGNFDRPVLVDEQDLHLFTEYSWSDNGNGYLRAFDKTTGRNVYLHRIIAGVTERWQIVDHINRDTYDIRRANLRVVTQKQNLNNRNDMAEAWDWVRRALA